MVLTTDGLMPDCPALAEAHAVASGICPAAQPTADILTLWDAFSSRPQADHAHYGQLRADSTGPGPQLVGSPGCRAKLWRPEPTTW